MSEREIIKGLVDLIQAWQRGIMTKIGITWIQQPPALAAALEYLKESNAP